MHSRRASEHKTNVVLQDILFVELLRTPCTQTQCQLSVAARKASPQAVARCLRSTSSRAATNSGFYEHGWVGVGTGLSKREPTSVDEV